MSSEKVINQTKLDPASIPVEAVPGVGKRTAASLKHIGVETVEDLLHHFPHRYLDLSQIKKISQVKVGDEVTVRGIVKDIKKIRSRRGTRVLSIGIFDGTGYIYATWFNQDFIADRLIKGIEVAFSGKTSWSYNQLQIQNPLFDILGEESDITKEAVHTGRIIPIHPATKSLSANRLRRIIKRALDDFGDVDDPLPSRLVYKYKLPSKQSAIKNIHFPDDRSLWSAARKRLIFEELFVLETGLLLRKKRLEGAAVGISHKVSGVLLKKFYALLPWKLTDDQEKVIAEIEADLSGSHPMHRLLQGEVGSGKTVVALATMLMVIEGGHQAAMMAPTEVLVEQHFLKLRPYLDELGIESLLILGSQKVAEKKEAQVKLAEGKAAIAFGTHALIQGGIKFKNLGVIVIDEQHRFGVRQRLSLRQKGNNPDVLVMTATPIPRTLSLTLYGDLDISILKKLPAGRQIGKHITTIFYPESKRRAAYQIIRDEIKAGRQAYIVCPLVDESDKLQMKSVLQEAEHLRQNVFPDLNVSILHGRMASAEKEQVMTDFREGRLDIMITTTVIEVGIDVPNATVMMIEHAERFGLSQLHQLRGRVGRGKEPSKCLLFADISSEEARQRIESFVKIKDGFELAETDLLLRGEGQIFGPRQSGLPGLRIAKLTKHENILRQARDEAMALLNSDPNLSKPEHRLLLAELKKRFAGNGEWLFSG